MRRDGVIGIVAIAVAIAGCAGAGGTSVLLELCSARATNLHTALLLYATDFDDRFPPGAVWMDGVTPYLGGQTSNLHCPALDAGEYGYAVHADIAGASWYDFPDPSLVTSVLETSDTAINAVGDEADMPGIARHGGRNVRLLLDGTLINEAP